MIATLGDYLRNNAYKFPDETAYTYEGRKVSFDGLLAGAQALSTALWRAGVRPQDRIAILSKNTLEFMQVYAACELTGFIAATVNWRLAPPEIAYIVKDATPRVLAFEAPYADTIDRIRGELDSVELFLCFGGDVPDWAEDYHAFVESGDRVDPPARSRPDQIVHLIYTSGTTGRPKGVMRTQQAEVASANLLAAECGMTVSDRLQLSMPLFHVGARFLQMAAHARGATVVLHHEFAAREVIEAIARERITVTHMAPTLIQAVLDLPDIRDHDLSSLQCICYAAAPMPTPLLRRGLELLGPVFLQLYGMTEGLGTTLHKRQHKLDGTPDELRRLGSVGQAAPTIDVRIGDDEGQEVALGTIGEILTRTDTHMLGYWNNTAATLEVLREGWYRTGDMGLMDEQGFVYLVDRKKDMIVSGGENIYSREVEEALASHPAVREVAVIGIGDDYWGESVCAIVVPAGGSEPGAEELIDHCRSQIASYKKPRSVIFVDALPILPSGKVNKVSLRKTYGGPGIFAANLPNGEAPPVGADD